MKEIPLTQGKVAIVDDDNYLELLKYKWHAARRHNLWYAARPNPNLRGDNILMHRIINNTPTGLDTDHIDGNGLNNQKSNLRTVTKWENQQNRHTKKTSKYHGVSSVKKSKRNPWRADCWLNGSITYLGCFPTEEAAHFAYIKARDEFKNPDWKAKP